MKRTFLFLLTIISYAASGQQPVAGQKISDMPLYVGNPKGAKVPIVLNNTNRSIDAADFGYDKIDSSSVGYGPTFDTIFFWKHGTKAFYTLNRASTTSGTTAAPTAPTPPFTDMSTRIANMQALAMLRDSLMKRMSDSLKVVDTSKHITFVNVGYGVGLFSTASANDTVKVLSLVGDSGISVSQSGNSIIVKVASNYPGFSGYASLSGNNTYLGSNTFMNSTTSANLFLSPIDGVREFGAKLVNSSETTIFYFFGTGNYVQTANGGPSYWNFYHGIESHNQPYSAGATLKLISGEVSKPGLVVEAATSQAALLMAWLSATHDTLGGIDAAGHLYLSGTPNYSSNAAALAALGVGKVYRNGGALNITY